MKWLNICMQHWRYTFPFGYINRTPWDILSIECFLQCIKRNYPAPSVSYSYSPLSMTSVRRKSDSASHLPYWRPETERCASLLSRIRNNTGLLHTINENIFSVVNVYELLCRSVFHLHRSFILSSITLICCYCEKLTRRAAFSQSIKRNILGGKKSVLSLIHTIRWNARTLK